MDMVAPLIDASPVPGTPAGRRRWSVALAALVGLAAGTGWLVWEATSADRSLRSLPAAQRRVVYQRTMEDLRTLCRPPVPEALRDHCRELAAVVAPLEECGADCAAVIRPILTPAPTR